MTVNKSIGSKMFGAKKVQVSTSDYGLIEIDVQLEAQSGFDVREIIRADWSEVFFGNVIVPCYYCGSYGAVKTKCKECGAPIRPV